MSNAYDVIIVGGGSAGSSLASKLSADPSTKVLVLEAGRWDYKWDVFIHMPAALFFMLGNPYYDWMYETEPEPFMNGRRVAHARGKVIGGSSSINGQIFQRGNPMDYERWAQEKGMASWDYAHCLPYFKKMENCLAGGDEWRGSSGPLKLDRGHLLPTHPLARALDRLQPGLKGRMALMSGSLGLLGFLLGAYQAGGPASPSAGMLTLGLTAAGGCALLGGFYLTRQVLRPIASLTRSVHQMAGGNLTAEVASAHHDEIGRLSEALTQVNANFTAIVRDARRGVSHLRSDTADIAHGNGDLNQRTIVSAGQLQQTAASVEQITTSVSQSAHKAEEATSMANAAKRALENQSRLVRFFRGNLPQMAAQPGEVSLYLLAVIVRIFEQCGGKIDRVAAAAH